MESRNLKLKKESRRFWLAVALAPLSVVVFEILRQIWVRGEVYLDYLHLYAIFSYVGMLLFGSPYSLLLRFKDKLTFVALLIGGLIAGPLYMEILEVVVNGQSARLRHLYSSDMILPAFLSVMVAAAFGLIAKVRIR